MQVCRSNGLAALLSRVGLSCRLPVGDRMEGKTVTIINRSEIVGRPLGALLANDGETSSP